MYIHYNKTFIHDVIGFSALWCIQIRFHVMYAIHTIIYIFLSTYFKLQLCCNHF